MLRCVAFGLFLLAIVWGGLSLMLSLRPAPAPTFIVYAQLDGQLWLLPSGGGQARPLPFQGYAPMWSPDGSWLAFQQSVAGSDQIFIARPFGRTAQQVTFDGSNWTPVWTPDGKALSFTRTENGRFRPLRHELATGQETPLGSGTRNETLPHWSPDGQWLTFSSNTFVADEPALTNDWEIYLLNIRTGESRYLTRYIGMDTLPAWSPDGRWIAYQAYQENQWDIFLSTPDRSQRRRLTFSHHDQTWARWSPDSQWLVYQGRSYGNQTHIYKLSLAGGQPEQLTQGQGDYLSPTWSPPMSLSWEGQRTLVGVLLLLCGGGLGIIRRGKPSLSIR